MKLKMTFKKKIGQAGLQWGTHLKWWIELMHLFWLIKTVVKKDISKQLNLDFTDFILIKLKVKKTMTSTISKLFTFNMAHSSNSRIWFASRTPSLSFFILSLYSAKNLEAAFKTLIAPAKKKKKKRQEIVINICKLHHLWMNKTFYSKLLMITEILFNLLIIWWCQ